MQRLWRGRPRRGFSLLELFVALALVGVLTAIAAASAATATQSTRARAGVATVAASLDAARALARLSLCEVRVRYIVRSHAMLATPTATTGPCSRIGTRRYDIDSTVELAGIRQGGVDVEEVLFSRSGALATQAVVSLELTTPTGARFIDVWPAIGTVGIR
jgi:prepilin-type N-terminal cleavage/methylation domain-containing protein